MLFATIKIFFRIKMLFCNIATISKNDRKPSKWTPSKEMCCRKWTLKKDWIPLRVTCRSNAFNLFRKNSTKYVMLKYSTASLINATVAYSTINLELQFLFYFTYSNITSNLHYYQNYNLAATCTKIVLSYIWS